MVPALEIWNLTVKPISNYADVSWEHNLPAGSSEFVLEFTLDSKRPDTNIRQSDASKPTVKVQNHN